MGEVRILTAEGDEPLAWDPDDAEQVERARARWDELKADGYEFYEVVESKGKKLKDFDPKLGKVIAAPGGRTKADREQGTRTHAMAGGPTTRAE